MTVWQPPAQVWALALCWPLDQFLNSRAQRGFSRPSLFVTDPSLLYKTGAWPRGSSFGIGLNILGLVQLDSSERWGSHSTPPGNGVQDLKVNCDIHMRVCWLCTPQKSCHWDALSAFCMPSSAFLSPSPLSSPYAKSLPSLPLSPHWSW